MTTASCFQINRAQQGECGWTTDLTFKPWTAQKSDWVQTRTLTPASVNRSSCWDLTAAGLTADCLILNSSTKCSIGFPLKRHSGLNVWQTPETQMFRLFKLPWSASSSLSFVMVVCSGCARWTTGAQKEEDRFQRSSPRTNSSCWNFKGSGWKSLYGTEPASTTLTKTLPVINIKHTASYLCAGSERTHPQRENWNQICLSHH